MSDACYPEMAEGENGMGIRGAPERTVRANELAIKALKPGEDRYIAWVEGHPKLGVRVTPKGARTWVYAYRFGGKLRWLTLGPLPCPAPEGGSRGMVRSRRQAGARRGPRRRQGGGQGTGRDHGGCIDRRVHDPVRQAKETHRC